jgi:hypothetical protein
VVTSSTKVESTLNKKHSALAYHYCWWAAAAGIISVAWIASQENLADAFTKWLAESVRDYLFVTGPIDQSDLTLKWESVRGDQMNMITIPFMTTVDSP